MTDFTEKEFFERIIAEKSKNGPIAISPHDLRSVLEEMGENFAFLRSSFCSAEDLKKTLTGMLSRAKERRIKTSSACFVIDVPTSADIEFVDGIAKVICEFFDGTVLWGMNFDNTLTESAFTICMICSNR